MVVVNEMQGETNALTSGLTIGLKRTTGITQDNSNGLTNDFNGPGSKTDESLDTCTGIYVDGIWGKSKKLIRYGKNKRFWFDMSVDGSSMQLRKEDVKKLNTWHGNKGKGKQIMDGDFSRKSRNNLLWTMGKLKRSSVDQDSVKLITLTYDGDTAKWLDKMDGREYKRHLKNITTAITRKYGGFAVWRWELQGRLVGHYHLIWYQVEGNWIDQDWLCNRWNDIIEGNQENIDQRVNIQTAESWKGVQLYGCKTLGYIAKGETSLDKRDHSRKIRIGRHWGTVNKGLLNEHCEMVQHSVSDSEYIKHERLNNKKQLAWKRKKAEVTGNWSFCSGEKSIKRFQRHLADLDNVKRKFYQDYEVSLDEIYFVRDGKLSYTRHISADGRIERIDNNKSIKMQYSLKMRLMFYKNSKRKKLELLLAS